MNPFNVSVKNPETNETNEIKIVEFVPTKGRGAGNPKLLPEGMSTWTLDDVSKIFGKERTFKTIVLPRLKQLFANMTSEATVQDDGVTPQTDENIIRRDFSEYLQVLSPRGETISALNARLNEIMDEELPAALEADNFTLAKTLSEEMKEIKADIAKKKRKDAPAATAPAAVAA